MPRPGDFIRKRGNAPPESMATEQQMFAATIANSANDENDDVFVLIQDFDEGTHKFGPVVWAPIAGKKGLFLPKKGAEALVSKPDRTLQIWMPLWKHGKEPDEEWS